MRLDGQRLLAPPKSPHCCPLVSLVFGCSRALGASIASSPPNEDPLGVLMRCGVTKAREATEGFPRRRFAKPVVERSAIRTQRVRPAGREATMHQSPEQPPRLGSAFTGRFPATSLAPSTRTRWVCSSREVRAIRDYDGRRLGFCGCGAPACLPSPEHKACGVRVSASAGPWREAAALTSQ